VTTTTPLPSWRDGAAKSAVLEFVRSVTERGDCFVPPEQRIATFDNDGTLWCEKPMYPQAHFLIRRWGTQVKADPTLAERQPWKAVAEGDRSWLASALDHLPELLKGVTEAYDGITTEDFEAAVRAFFDTVQHPTLGVPYTHIAFRPMCELIELLHAHEFDVYICSAGGRDFVRVIAHEMYGLRRTHVIGSGPTLEYRDGAVYRTRGIEQPIADGAGKPVHIWTRTGQRPLLAGGNADGDGPMLETARFALLIHHDDAAREFVYDTGAETVLAQAGERGWTIVSMKDDFETVF